MLYTYVPRTFDLNDVTGVMNICDRHMGAIAMRLFYNLCICPLCCAWVHPAWLTRDRRCVCAWLLRLWGPTASVQLSLPTTPAFIEAENRRGCIFYHLIRASTRHCPSAIGPHFLTTSYPSTTLFKHSKNTLLKQDTTGQKRSVGVGSSVCKGHSFCN